nr:reverse transcriptase domain-containing protein [Tanacetum cinerariifolium]
MPRECLAIIESKSKVRYSRNKPVVAKVSTNTSTSGISPDVAELKYMVKALLLDKKGQNQSPAPMKAVKESCVTCGVNYNQGNTSYRPLMMSNQIRPPGFPPVPNNQNVQRNNQNRFIPNQNWGNNFNQGPVYQPPVFQPPAYQPPAYQAPAPQTQCVSKEDFSAYVKANDAVMRNMQTQGTLPSNTIANPRSDLKAITTRSGVSYDGPQIPPSTSFTPKVVEDEPEATKDTVNPTNNKSTEDVQPQDVQSKSSILTSVPITFPISEPVIAPVTLADLGASINLMPFSVWKRLSLPDLTPTCMTLELADRSISRPVRVAEDVYVKVGSFHFSTDFVVVDFDADPRVPLILRRLFFKTERALIDVFKGKLTLHVGKEAITFNLDQTSRYSANYSDMTAKQIDIIDMACEEYSQEVLGFSDTISSGNPTPYYDPIVSTTSPTLTLFRNSDFLLEEVDAFLAIEDDPTSPEFSQPYLDLERDILLLEAFLNDDPSLPPPNQGNYLPEVHKELKICEAKSDKSLVDEPSKVELKDLPPHIEYALLEGDKNLPVIIAKDLSVEEKTTLITALKSHKVNPKIHDVTKQEVIKLLEAGLIYPISDSPWHVCIDYRKLNEATRKDHFPLPFVDQMLERLTENQYYCFLDGFFGYFQIPINPKDQEKTTFTCPYGTFAYRRMPFGLCNALCTFQRCMMEIFHDMIEKTMEVFMDDFSVFGNSFQSCLSYLERMLKRCEDTNLCLNWEKSHFMVKEGIVLDHKISKQGIKVDKAKVDVITKLLHPTTVKVIRIFLGHAGFYRHFIKDFSKIARLMTRLLKKDTPFIFSQECVDAFQTLKRKLTEAPILIALDWDMPFELMCDASDFAIGAVPGQHQDKHFKPIHYASKTMTEAKSNYTTTKIEMLAVVYAFEKFRSYLIMNKSIEFTFKVIDIKGAENLAADHLSRLKNPHQNVLDPKEINESFPLETLNLVSTRGNQSTPWFADFANYHARNFIVKGMSCHPSRKEAIEILKACHYGPTGGHHGPNYTAKKTSGQVKVSNRGLKRILERAVGKLKSRWSSPFTISQVYPYGTIELSQPDGPNFKVNGHRLKHYFGEDVPKLVVPDLQTFSRDH